MSVSLIAMLLTTALATPAASHVIPTPAPRPQPVAIRVQEVRPQIAGSWLINEAESQRPQESRAGGGQRGAMTPMSGGGGGGGRRRGGGGGGGGGGSSSSGKSSPQAQLKAALAELGNTNLMITQQDSTVTFIDAGGAPIVVRTNGKNTDMDWGETIGEVETKAQWTAEGFQLERKFDGGVKVREVYQRTPGSPKLTIVTTVSAKILAEDFSFRRVYDPAPAK